jgi:Domain of unknown function (DUF1942)
MNAISRAAAVVGTVAVTVSMGMAGASGAPATIGSAAFGSPQVVDDGTAAIAYTVHDLSPSGSDALSVPLTGDVPLAGDLWQATTSVAPVRGAAVPSMNFFNARTADGQNYRVLVQTLAPDVGTSPMDQSVTSTGRIYFDVTGPEPTEVVYDDGQHSPMVWTR